MHMVIRAIVYAPNEEQGLVNARDVFDRLIEGSIFDYYVTFDEENQKVAGKDRWGALPVIASADSDEGKKLIEDGMRFTKEEFFEHLKVVREALASKSDEEVFESRFDIRYRLSCLGEVRGPSVWLYDADGEGIRTTEYLKDVLNKWSNEKLDKLKVFVVPADVHF